MRVAILGCGSIGRRHARNLIGLGHGELVLYDPDPAVRAGVETSARISIAETLEDVWRSDPGVVFVTAPTYLHVPLALQAARRGCDLFIEKPLSLSWDGVEELCAEIDRQGLVSMVGCNMRFHPGPASLKRLLDSGAIGRVQAARIHSGSYLPDWQPGTNYRGRYSASAAQGGGAILDCIHEIDLALWYFGPGSVIAAATVPADGIGLDVEGLAEILIRHESGVLTSVHLNFVQTNYQRECSVIGASGTLSWSFGEAGVRWRGRVGEPTQDHPLPSDWDVNDMYVDELRSFLECVERRSPTVHPVGDARSVLRMALNVKAAARGEQSRGRDVASPV